MSMVSGVLQAFSQDSGGQVHRDKLVSAKKRVREDKEEQSFQNLKKVKVINRGPKPDRNKKFVDDVLRVVSFFKSLNEECLFNKAPDIGFWNAYFTTLSSYFKTEYGKMLKDVIDSIRSWEASGPRGDIGLFFKMMIVKLKDLMLSGEFKYLSLSRKKIANFSGMPIDFKMPKKYSVYSFFLSINVKELLGDKPVFPALLILFRDRLIHEYEAYQGRIENSLIQKFIREDFYQNQSISDIDSESSFCDDIFFNFSPEIVDKVEDKNVGK